MKRIGLVVPYGRDAAMACATRAASFLMQKGVAVDVEAGAASLLAGCGILTDVSQVDAVVTLGGDGTLLRGALLAVRSQAVLMGVNLGHKGFLAETHPQQLEQALQNLLDGKYQIEERPVLTAVVDGRSVGYAMNDAVITRGGFARLIRVRAVVDEQEAGQYRADGLIIATPTGSTGYSLSAGGPIVSPNVPCIAITPVCAHSLQHCPLIVGQDSRIRLEMGDDEEMTAELQLDGQNAAQLRAGQVVEVFKADCSVKLVHFHKTPFFKLVREKLTEWSS